MPKIEKSIDYECCRCGYHTHRLPLMRGHLYKKRPCPAAKSSIVLTDDIKEKILADRVYNPPVERAPQTRKGLSGFIYIIQLREHILLNQPIYTIGRTADIFTRFDSYPKESKLLFMEAVHNHVDVETELIRKLKADKQIKHKDKIGREFFECGDLKYFKKQVKDLVDKHLFIEKEQYKDDLEDSKPNIDPETQKKLDMLDKFMTLMKTI